MYTRGTVICDKDLGITFSSSNEPLTSCWCYEKWLTFPISLSWGYKTAGTRNASLVSGLNHRPTGLHDLSPSSKKREWQENVKDWWISIQVAYDFPLIDSLCYDTSPPVSEPHTSKYYCCQQSLEKSGECEYGCAQAAEGRTELVALTSSVQNVFSPLTSISDHLRSLL